MNLMTFTRVTILYGSCMDGIPEVLMFIAVITVCLVVDVSCLMLGRQLTNSYKISPRHLE